MKIWSARLQKYPIIITPTVLIFAFLLVQTIASDFQPTSGISITIYVLLGLMILVIIFYNLFYKDHLKGKIGESEKELKKGEGKGKGESGNEELEDKKRQQEKAKEEE